MRNRLYSLINLAGLTLSLALVIIIFSYAGAQRRTARAVPDYENTYAVTWEGDGLLCYGVSDRLSGLPEAEAVTMFSGAYEDCVCEFGEKTFLSDIMCADAGFFDFFDIKFLKGSPDRFSVTGAFISESFARRLAGEDDPEGRQLQIDGDSFTVAGVFKDFGKGLLPSADIIINDYAPSGPMLQYKEQPLNTFGNVLVFVRLTEGCDIRSVNDKLNELFKDTESVYGKLSLMRRIPNPSTGNYLSCAPTNSISAKGMSSLKRESPNSSAT